MDDRNEGCYRLAFLTNIPSPYRAGMARAWVRGNPGLALSVFYTDQGDQGRGWGADPIGKPVDEVRLPILAHIKRYGKLNRKLVAMVRNHDAIMIGGFEQASYLVVAIMARLARKPVILLFDGFSPIRFGTEPSPILALKRLTARLAKGLFANGTVGAAYLREQLQVPVTQPIRNQFLSHRSEQIGDARRALSGLSKTQIRKRLRIDAGGRQVLLCCGYLIRRKRIDLVIDALANLPVARRPLLLIVGSGPLADDLHAQAMRLSVPTHFAGFKLESELAEYYFSADALVLASADDPWGLVVNEAMDAGLPIVVSDACGASLDLVREDMNGFVFRSGDVRSLLLAIDRLLTADLEHMGAISRTIISDWTPARSAESLRAALVDADPLFCARTTS